MTFRIGFRRPSAIVIAITQTCRQPLFNARYTLFNPANCQSLRRYPPPSSSSSSLLHMCTQSSSLPTCTQSTIFLPRRDFFAYVSTRSGREGMSRMYQVSSQPKSVSTTSILVLYFFHIVLFYIVCHLLPAVCFSSSIFSCLSYVVHLLLSM